jgi:hypothetical protein
MELQDVIERLRSAVQTEGSQAAFAEKHIISLQYVNDVLRGRREPGPIILNALGLERIVTYREKK